MSYYPPVDFNAAVRVGKVADWSAFSFVCHSETMDTNERIVHHEMGTAGLSVDSLLDTPAVVKVASTSANDTNTAGTGARTVQITGLVSGAVTSETITLAGTTEATSVNTYSAIHAMQVLTAGSTGSNEGTIWCGTGTFTAGVPATKYDSMGIGHNLNGLAYRVVPTGYKWVIQQIGIETSDTTKLMTLTFWQRANATGLWYKAYEVDLKGDSTYILDVKAYPALVAGDAIKFTAKVDTGTAKITANAAGYLITV